MKFHWVRNSALLLVLLPAGDLAVGAQEAPLSAEARELKTLGEQFTGLQARRDRIQKLLDDPAGLKTPEARDIASKQIAEVGKQIEALGQREAKLKAILEIERLLPELAGGSKNAALDKLAELRVQLRAAPSAPPAPAGDSTPQNPPPSSNPSNPPGGTTGSGLQKNSGANGYRMLTGVILGGAPCLYYQLQERLFPDDPVKRDAGCVLPKQVNRNVAAERDPKKFEKEYLKATNWTLVHDQWTWKPLENVEVQATCTTDQGGGSQSKVQLPWTATDPHGVFRVEGAPKDSRCDLTFGRGSFEPFSVTGWKAEDNHTDLGEIRLKHLEHGTGEFARAIVGFEQSGASAASSEQKFFSDLFISTPRPLAFNPDPIFGSPLRFWGDIRITSTPQQVQSTLGDFAISLPQQFSNVRVNEVAQASEFLAGVELRLYSFYPLLSSFDRQTKQRFSMHFVLGGGVITPLNPRDSLQVFQVPDRAAEPAFFTRPETAGVDFTNKQFVAFATQDRNRFFRQYYAGIRLKTFYYDHYGNPLPRFPAMLDLLVGQNESVSGGRLRGAVIRLDGFYPLPFENARYIYLYGLALLKPTKVSLSNAIILQPAPAGTPVPSPSTVIITLPQINRDYYRFGVGIDAISLFQYLREKQQLAKQLSQGQAKKE